MRRYHNHIDTKPCLYCYPVSYRFYVRLTVLLITTDPVPVSIEYVKETIRYQIHMYIINIYIELNRICPLNYILYIEYI